MTEGIGLTQKASSNRWLPILSVSLRLTAEVARRATFPLLQARGA